MTSIDLPEREMFELLQAITLEELLEDQIKIQPLLNHQIVKESIKILTAQKVLAAPVVNTSNNRTCAVDMLDIIKFVNHVAPDSESLRENELRSLEVSGRALSFARLQEVIDFSGKAYSSTLSIRNTAADALVIFSEGAQRIPIVDDEGQIYNILNQGDIIQSLKKQMDKGTFFKVFEQSISILKPISPQTILAIDSVLKAIQLLTKSTHPSVALLDLEGHLVGSFSVWDLQGLFEQIPSFLLPVGTFLLKNSECSFHPITASPKTKISKAIEKIVNNQQESLWIVNKQRKPIGMLSLADILKFIC